MTPTFNRAHTLPRVFESLSAQTFTDFEWLVIDDGSTDDTKLLVEAWAHAASFPVRYHYQPNSGKAAAENVAAELARGCMLAVLDSDDWYAPDALETFATAWSSIEPHWRHDFAGVVALCADQEGVVVGDRFPEAILDTNYSELRSRYLVGGDKAGCLRTDVARRFPYPLFPGETKGTFESTVLRRIARELRCRCVDQVVTIKEYQPDGVTASGGGLWVESPRSAKLTILESLVDDDLTRRRRVENYAHHFRFSVHAGLARDSWSDSPSKVLWLVTAPVGVALYVRDCWRMRRRPTP